MFEDLKKLAAESEEIQARIRKAAQEQVAPVLKQAYLELVAKVPKVKALRWRQYTPYFNDGESCTFGVRDPYVLLSDVEEDSEEGDFEDGYAEMSAWTFQSTIGSLTLAESKLLEDFRKEFSSISDGMFEAAFGDHARVTIDEHGIEIEEYDHD